MSYDFYRVLHLVGLAAVFLGLGGIFAGGRKTFSMLNGVGLLLMLVSGFGMQAKASLEFKGWLISMIGIWVLISLVPVATKRKILPAPIAALVALALVGTAAWLGLTRPF
ncbi:MAG: hypothetical protein U1F36_23620 [Planctomycetota bacterium]